MILRTIVSDRPASSISLRLSCHAYTREYIHHPRPYHADDHLNPTGFSTSATVKVACRHNKRSWT